MIQSKKVRVISICSAQHSNVWKLTSELLPRHVQADEYVVYVPENEVNFFKEITSPRIEIKAQEELGSIFKNSLRLALENVNNDKRLGWYLQQFYKIEAMRVSSSEIVAIWDADCVPVSTIKLQDEKGRPLFLNSSREFHPPYFETIQRLLEMSRVQDFCFVIPGFPMKQHWVTDFTDFIEEKHGIPWHEAIIQNTDLSQTSGFSETETLGTWLANRYPQEWSVQKGTWERFGQSRFGYAKNYSPDLIENLGKRKDLQIITFENWDVRGLAKISRRLRQVWNR